MAKKILTLSIRLGVAFVICWYLYATLEWREIGGLIKQSDWKWMVTAFLCYGITTALGIWRWHILLKAYHAPMKWIRTIQLTMIGLFANTFMPGGMSGDVIKIYYAVRELPHIKPTVVMSVIMERFLGFIAMFLISTALILSHYKELTSEPASKYAVYFYFIVLGLTTAAILAGAWGKIPLSKKLPFYESLKEAGKAYRFFLSHPVCFWGGLAISSVAQFFLMGTFYFVAVGLGINASFWGLAAVLPLVQLVTILPIMPNGIGLREAASKHFLAFLKITEEARVALSLGGSVIILIWNLLGGLVYLQFRGHFLPVEKKEA